MPKLTHEHVGNIYRTRKVPTIWDKLKIAAQNIVGFLAILMIIGLIFGG